MKRLLTLVQELSPPEFRTVGSWLMVGGMPNVGKSSLLNALRGGSSSRTAPVPCVTRGLNSFRICRDPLLYVLDTPGLAYRRVDDNEDAYKLALCGLIRDGIVPAEVLFDYALHSLNRVQQLRYVHAYGLKGPVQDYKVLEEVITRRLNAADPSVAHDRLLRDFRAGVLGRVLLDEL